MLFLFVSHIQIEKRKKFMDEECPSFLEKFDKLLQSNGHFVGEGVIVI